MAAKLFRGEEGAARLVRYFLPHWAGGSAWAKRAATKARHDECPSIAQVGEVTVIIRQNIVENDDYRVEAAIVITKVRDFRTVASFPNFDEDCAIKARHFR